MNSSVIGIILLIFSALLYAPQTPLTKNIFPIMGPINTLFLFVSLTIPLFIIYYLIRFKSLPKFEKDHISDIFTISFFSGIGPLIYLYALNFTTVKNVIFTAAVSGAIINVIMGRKFLDERIDIYLIFGGILAVFGSLLISTNGMISLPNIISFIVVFSMLADSIRNTVSKKYFKKKSVQEATFIQVVGGCITILIILLPFISPDNFIFSPISIFSIFYISFFTLIIAKILFLMGLDKIGLSKTSLIFGAIQPIFVSIFAYLIVRETFTTYDFIGATLTLVGITIINWKKIKNKD